MPGAVGYVMLLAYGSATPEEYFPAFMGLFIVLFLASGIGNAWKMLGAVAGMTLAWLLDRRYIHFETQAVWWVQVIKVAVGMALLLAIKSGLKAPLLALLGHEGLAGGVRYFLLVLVAGAVWPLVFRPMSKWGKGKK